MDNFVNFLLDYYIWILGVLLIIIITVIGFLVDSKQKRKKKEQLINKETKSENLEEVKTVEKLPTNNSGENINNQNQIVSNVNNNGVATVTTGVQQIQTPVKNVNDVSGNSVGVDSNSNQVSLVEQKPHFEAREVNIPVSQSSVNKPTIQQPTYQYNQQATNVNQNMSGFVPRPVNAVSINGNQSMQQQYNNLSPNNNYMQSRQNSQVNTYNIQQPANVNQNSYVANQVPVQSIQQPISQTPTMVQNMNQQQNIQTSTMPNVGINFVTGPNTDEDKWKL